MGTGKTVPQCFIGDGVNSSATTLPTIAKGDLFLVKDGALVTTTAAAAALSKNDKVQIAVGIDTGKALLSLPIKGTDVKSFLGNKYDAPTQEVAYIGYNGTSGTLPTSVSTHYRMRIRFKGAHVLSTRSPWFGDVIATTGTSTTQSALAFKLVDGFNTNSDAAKYVKAERVSNGTKKATTGTGALGVTNGSKYVTCTNADAVLAVGDGLVFGTTATSPVYIVTAIDATNNIITLDTKYTGDTNSAYAEASATYIEAADVATAAFGIKLTGLEIEDLLADYDPYKVSNFEAFFAEVGVEGTQDSAALITYSVGAFPGNGYYRQVRADELEAQTFRGWHDKTEYYHSKPTRLTATSGGYDSVFIEYTNESTGDFGQKWDHPLVAKIYIPTGTAQSDEDTANSFASILNGYFSTVCGFTAINLDA